MAQTTTGLFLHCLVMSAKNLAHKDFFGLCDPYVKVSLLKRSKSVVTYHTKTKKNTHNPVWNELFVFNEVVPENFSLLLDVFDANKITRDNFLGRLRINLNSNSIPRKRVGIGEGIVSSVTYPLKPRSHKSHVSGTLTIKLLYFNDPPPQPSQPNFLEEVVVGATGQSPSTPVLVEQSVQPVQGTVDHQSPLVIEDRVVDEDEQPLPGGWEARQDANGRTFYVDHNNRHTQWERPSMGTTRSNMVAEREAERRRQLAHTMARRNPALESSLYNSTLSLVNAEEPRRVSTSHVSNGSHSAVSPTDPQLNRTKSPHFPTAGSTSPSQNGEVELPPGWEKRWTTTGKVFYINHNKRETQWHPPTPEQLKESLKNSPRPMSIAIVTSPQQAPSAEKQYSEAELGPLPVNWEKRTMPNGRAFFIDHNTKSTQWEDPRLIKKKQAAAAAVPYSRDYKLKYENFRKQLAQKKPENLPRMFEIPVRRNNIFEDSHRAIMTCKNRDHLKTRLWVKFEGEVGLDYGGVSREWFFLLSHEMFNPYYGLFEYAASDNYTLQINPNSGQCNEHHFQYFRFVGRILAMAIYHQRLIDGYFIRPMYKLLLEKKLILSDMEAVDSEFYSSVKYILNNDPEPLCLTFTAAREFLGKIEEVDLKPDGANIEVTDKNKREYVRLLVKWRFADRISKQMEQIKKGFNDIFPLKMLQIFDERELEYLMCGIGEIDVNDWKKNSIYTNGYTISSNQIVWFWKAVENFDNEMRARLLQFVTGTSRVPMNGFAELQGSNGLQKFCIKKLGTPASLPRAHTCFNRIDLPPYTSYHDLKEKLRIAVENCEGFEGVD